MHVHVVVATLDVVHDLGAHVDALGSFDRVVRRALESARQFLRLDRHVEPLSVVQH